MLKAGAQGPQGSLSVPPPVPEVSTKGLKGEAETKNAPRVSAWPISVPCGGEESR